jgi:anti-anti-sigma factor
MTDHTSFYAGGAAPEQDRHVVELRGELDLETATGLADGLTDMADSVVVVVVDLSGLMFIDARGLSSLLEAKRRIEAEGHSIEFRHASGVVRRVFDVLSLSDLLTD